MNYYLERFALRDPLIDQGPVRVLGMVVVVPCCNETELLASLESLFNCDRPDCAVEVIVVINASEDADEDVLLQNGRTLKEGLKWQATHQDEGLQFYFIEENALPKKDAGVGLARKIGMDEAVRRLEAIHNPKGVIVCFDADSLCDPNYLVEIEKHFAKDPKTSACSIHFEHPLSGIEFSEKIYDGIARYELHLRYYKNGLAYAGLPYAYHTIGSSMAVRSSAYQKQNGMNKRKAGEDFYFLQKLIPLGDFTEIKTTKVIPSPRVSNRVPFGTGKAMQNWLDEGKQELLSYNIQSFIDLKAFAEGVPKLYVSNTIHFPESVWEFLKTIDLDKNLKKIRANSTSKAHFVKLFFNWFNAFKTLKYMHFARDNYYPDAPVAEGASSLLKLTGNKEQQLLKDLLMYYRSMDL